MKTNKHAKIAIFLWVITISIFAWFFIRGSTTMGNDGRTVLVLQPAEREFIMSEMRGLLVSTQGILEAANQGDLQLLIKIARKAGMAGAIDANPTLITKLPLEFKRLGMGLHTDMDEIAKAAENGKAVPELLKMTSNMLNKCVACHAVWQIKI